MVAEELFWKEIVRSSEVEEAFFTPCFGFEVKNCTFDFQREVPTSRQGPHVYKLTSACIIDLDCPVLRVSSRG